MAQRYTASQIGQHIKSIAPDNRYDKYTDFELGVRAFRLKPDEYPDYDDSEEKSVTDSLKKVRSPGDKFYIPTPTVDNRGVEAITNPDWTRTLSQQPGNFLDKVIKTIPPTVSGGAEMIKRVGSPAAAAATALKIGRQYVPGMDKLPVLPGEREREAGDRFLDSIGNAAERAGKAYEESAVGRALAPDAYVDDTWTSKIVGGAGTVSGMAAPAALTGGATFIPQAAAMGAGEARRSMNEYEKKTGTQIPEGARALDVLGNAAINAGESFIGPEAAMAKGFGKLTVDEAKKLLAHYAARDGLKGMARDFGSEIFQEVVQLGLGDALDKLTYDPNRSLFDNLKDTIAGAIGGAGVARGIRKVVTPGIKSRLEAQIEEEEGSVGSGDGGAGNVDAATGTGGAEVAAVPAAAKSVVPSVDGGAVADSNAVTDTITTAKGYKIPATFVGKNGQTYKFVPKGPNYDVIVNGRKTRTVSPAESFKLFSTFGKTDEVKAVIDAGKVNKAGTVSAGNVPAIVPAPATTQTVNTSIDDGDILQNVLASNPSLQNKFDDYIINKVTQNLKKKSPVTSQEMAVYQAALARKYPGVVLQSEEKAVGDGSKIATVDPREGQIQELQKQIAALQNAVKVQDQGVTPPIDPKDQQIANLQSQIDKLRDQLIGRPQGWKEGEVKRAAPKPVTPTVSPTDSPITQTKEPEPKTWSPYGGMPGVPAAIIDQDGRVIPVPVQPQVQVTAPVQQTESKPRPVKPPQSGGWEYGQVRRKAAGVGPEDIKAADLQVSDSGREDIGRPEKSDTAETEQLVRQGVLPITVTRDISNARNAIFHLPGEGQRLLESGERQTQTVLKPVTSPYTVVDRGEGRTRYPEQRLLSDGTKPTATTIVEDKPQEPKPVRPPITVKPVTEPVTEPVTKPVQESTSTTTPEPKYSFGSTQIDIDHQATRDRAARFKFREDDLYQRESDPHITVKYGVKDPSPENIEKIRQAAAKVTPFEVVLGKTSLFPDSGDGEVVKVDAESKALRNLNELIASTVDTENTQPSYIPHMTLGHVMPGTGRRYVGKSEFEGTKIPVTKFVVSDRNGNKVEIPLGGGVVTSGTGVTGGTVKTPKKVKSPRAAKAKAEARVEAQVVETPVAETPVTETPVTETATVTTPATTPDTAPDTTPSTKYTGPLSKFIGHSKVVSNAIHNKLQRKYSRAITKGSDYREFSQDSELLTKSLQDRAPTKPPSLEDIRKWLIWNDYKIDGPLVIDTNELHNYSLGTSRVFRDMIAEAERLGVGKRSDNTTIVLQPDEVKKFVELDRTEHPELGDEPPTPPEPPATTPEPPPASEPSATKKSHIPVVRRPGERGSFSNKPKSDTVPPTVDITKRSTTGKQNVNQKLDDFLKRIRAGMSDSVNRTFDENFSSDAVRERMLHIKRNFKQFVEDFLHGVKSTVLNTGTQLQTMYGSYGKDIYNVLDLSRHVGEINGGQWVDLMRKHGLDNPRFHKPRYIQTLHDLMGGFVLYDENDPIHKELEPLYNIMRTADDSVAMEAVLLDLKSRAVGGKWYKFKPVAHHFARVYNWSGMKSHGPVRRDIINNMIARGWAKDRQDAGQLIDEIYDFMHGKESKDPGSRLMEWARDHGQFHVEDADAKSDETLIDELSDEEIDNMTDDELAELGVLTEEQVVKDSDKDRNLRRVSDDSIRKALAAYRNQVRGINDNKSPRHLSLDYKRRTILPVYDPNMFRVIPESIVTSNVRLARIAMIGQDDELIKSILTSALTENHNVDNMRSLIGTLLKVDPKIPANSGLHRLERFLSTITTYRMVTSALPNSFQTLNVAQVSTVGTFVNAVANGFSENSRSLAVGAGNITDEILRASYHGDDSGSLLSRGVNVQLSLNKFKATEKANHQIASVAGVTYAQDLLGAVKRDMTRLGIKDFAEYSNKVKEVQSRVPFTTKAARYEADKARFSVDFLQDFYKFTPEDIQQMLDGEGEFKSRGTTVDDVGMSRFQQLWAAKMMDEYTNFRSIPDNLPPWASNSVMGRLIFKFKHFSWQQMRFQYRNFMEWLRTGKSLLKGDANTYAIRRALGSMFQLSVVNPIIGIGIAQTANLIRKRDWKEYEDNFWRYIDGHMNQGSLGMMADMTKAIANEDAISTAMFKYATGAPAQFVADSMITPQAMYQHIFVKDKEGRTYPKKAVGDFYRYVVNTFPLLGIATNWLVPAMENAGMHPSGRAEDQLTKKRMKSGYSTYQMKMDKDRAQKARELRRKDKLEAVQ